MTMAIKNIAKLNDLKLTETLRQHEIAVPEGTTRPGLLALAREHKLWDYQGNVVPLSYKAKYGPTQRCGDELSDAINAATRNADGSVDLEAVQLLQKANGLETARWSHLNNGQQVMNTSNVLRGKLRRAEYVVVGTTEWNKTAKVEVAPKAKSKKK